MVLWANPQVDLAPYVQRERARQRLTCADHATVGSRRVLKRGDQVLSHSRDTL